MTTHLLAATVAVEQLINPKQIKTQVYGNLKSKVRKTDKFQ
jgi:hypothetical protein